ncbi:PREDICTED: ragulator complex protein LAMTOR5 homolog [Papilio xuthus]|uniref:Late endosomal/lysosomal adaptor and MAPK and MTOR activator 5 n=1 Tax=Papilio xuthus TaxID=66420 RepID=A0A194PYT8_PAPXU|nr:PREDICTED: ragulator complex protein LAMTOR5 homolog [Papilio xuthus]KPI98491.1 Protein HBXIP-like [Papilio xuthus]
MEKDLDKVVDEIMATPQINGCIVADHQGLCLAAKGTAHVDSAGIIVALSEQACKIQPNLKPPTICLETDKKLCLVQRHGTITGAIFKLKP